MKKNKSEKISAPLRRSTFDEVLESMNKKGFFGGFMDCPYYERGLNGDWDDSYNCSLNRKIDEEYGARFCGECDFSGNNYLNCQRYNNCKF